MRATIGEMLRGPAGAATEVFVTGPFDRPDQQALVAAWFLDCPGQSAAWRHYGLSVIHLRPIDGAAPAHIRVPQSTHEVILAAINPDANPVAADPNTWHPLQPLNVMEQLQLPGDHAARQLARLAAEAVVSGRLPAEPPLAGAVEPWRTSMIKTAAHLRGEEHAP